MKINFVDSKPQTIKVVFVDLEMEKAHKSLQNEKRVVLSQLVQIMKNKEIPTIYRKWIKQAGRMILEEVK